MEHIHQDINKTTLEDRKKSASANKISRIERYELEEQINSLQRVFAHERGESHRFREAVRAKLGLSEPEEEEEGHNRK